ncbi:hypothetical protein BD560DRAFT_428405 [Blakeslea trispora]|nr:hypothetical protein BD560DRAFT_428405 [Blakeslea trispora]
MLMRGVTKSVAYDRKEFYLYLNHGDSCNTMLYEFFEKPANGTHNFVRVYSPKNGLVNIEIGTLQLCLYKSQHHLHVCKENNTSIEKVCCLRSQLRNNSSGRNVALMKTVPSTVDQDLMEYYHACSVHNKTQTHFKSNSSSSLIEPVLCGALSSAEIIKDASNLSSVPSPPMSQPSKTTASPI